VGIANLAAALDPGTFVIGGGVSDAGDLLIRPATESFRRSLTGRGFRPEPRIVRAHLGNQAGMIGAADLARSVARRGRRRSRSRRTSSVTGFGLGLGMSRADQRATRVVAREYRSGR
jgi:glucokinase